MQALNSNPPPDSRALAPNYSILDRGFGLTLAIGLTLLLGLAGCPAEPQGRKAAPQVKVNLPASPPMTEPTFVEKYVDGNYTVAGLIRSRAKLINSEVKVKGYIQTNHLCDLSEEPCEPPPHAILVDDLLRPHKRLILLGGADTILPELREKDVVTLEGRYVQSDPQGLFIRMEGLLILPPKEPVEEEEAPKKKKRRRRK
jgi:hypothetical protein